MYFKHYKWKDKNNKRGLKPYKNLFRKLLSKQTKIKEKKLHIIQKGYLNLAPGFSTRNNTNQFIEKRPVLSLTTVRPIRKRKTQNEAEVVDNKVRKLIHE